MDESRTEIRGSYRPPVPGSRRVGIPDADEVITLTVTVRGPVPPGADAHPAPALSRPEFEALFGARQDDIDQVGAVLGRRGMTVLDSSRLTRSLHVEGTIATVASTFGADLGRYRTLGGEEFRGRVGTVTLPAALSGIVTGVFGLDQRRVAERKSAPSPDSADDLAVTPPDLERMYRFPDGDASGRRVAIAEFGGGYFPGDATQFCQMYGRPDPVPALSVIPVGYQPLTLAELEKLPESELIRQAVLTAECMLDIEIVTALCPGAEVAVYYAPFTEAGWIDLLGAVISDPPSVALSVSWGIREDQAHGLSQAGLAEISQRLAAAAALGVTVCAASGDDGSGDNANDAGVHVAFPAASPFVLGVGGTMLSAGQEVAWREGPGTRFAPDGSPTNGGASGGGISTVFPRPPWQDVRVEPPAGRHFDGRIVPDVSAIASVRGYNMIFNGQPVRSGGTSAAAPVWASLITRATAAAGGSQRFLTPVLYGPFPGTEPLGRAVCQDITVGTNVSEPQPGVGYSAQPGYDAVTGWGTPNGIALVQSLKALQDHEAEGGSKNDRNADTKRAGSAARRTGESGHDRRHRDAAQRRGKP
jgi:kumamolisin